MYYLSSLFRDLGAGWQCEGASDSSGHQDGERNGPHHRLTAGNPLPGPPHADM